MLALFTSSLSSCANYLPHLLEQLAVVHALIALLPYLLDKPFELPVHTSTNCTSLQWLQPLSSSSRGTSLIIKRAGLAC